MAWEDQFDQASLEGLMWSVMIPGSRSNSCSILSSCATKPHACGVDGLQFWNAMSRTGLVLCALYATVIAACAAFVFLDNADPKGSYVLLQLPIALQSALMVGIGLAPRLEGISWCEAYVLLAGPLFALLYGLGALIDRSRLKLK